MDMDLTPILSALSQFSDLSLHIAFPPRTLLPMRRPNVSKSEIEHTLSMLEKNTTQSRLIGSKRKYTQLQIHLPSQVRTKAKHHRARDAWVSLFTRVHGEVRGQVGPPTEYASAARKRAHDRRTAGRGLLVAQ